MGWPGDGVPGGAVVGKFPAFYFSGKLTTLIADTCNTIKDICIYLEIYVLQ